MNHLKLDKFKTGYFKSKIEYKIYYLLFFFLLKFLNQLYSSLLFYYQISKMMIQEKFKLPMRKDFTISSSSDKDGFQTNINYEITAIIQELKTKGFIDIKIFKNIIARTNKILCKKLIISRKRGQHHKVLITCDDNWRYTWVNFL